MGCRSKKKRVRFGIYSPGYGTKDYTPKEHVSATQELLEHAMSKDSSSGGNVCGGGSSDDSGSVADIFVELTKAGRGMLSACRKLEKMGYKTFQNFSYTTLGYFANIKEELKKDNPTFTGEILWNYPAIPYQWFLIEHKNNIPNLTAKNYNGADYRLTMENPLTINSDNIGDVRLRFTPSEEDKGHFLAELNREVCTNYLGGIPDPSLNREQDLLIPGETAKIYTHDTLIEVIHIASYDYERRIYNLVEVNVAKDEKEENLERKYEIEKVTAYYHRERRKPLPLGDPIYIYHKQ